MDLSFRVHDGARAPVRMPVDYAMLVAGIASQQSASRTGAIAARLAPRPDAAPKPNGPLAALVLGDRGWAAAAAALHGSFHPRIAAQIGGKPRSTIMTRAFTFAF